jgi:hypothetical protein
MKSNKRTLISCRLLPELKKELQEEASAYEMTLSSYLEWILANRPIVDEQYLFWEEEKKELLQRIKLLEVSFRACQRIRKLKENS